MLDKLDEKLVGYKKNIHNPKKLFFVSGGLLNRGQALAGRLGR